MAPSSPSADPTTTTSNAVVNAVPTSNPIKTTISLGSTSTAASPVRPMAGMLQLQPLSQARRPQLIQHQQQRQHPSTNQQQSLAGMAQSPTQTQTLATNNVVYPLASSGHGLLPTPQPQLAEQRVLMANPGVYPMAAKAIVAAYHPPPPQTQHQYGRLSASSDPPQPPHTSYSFRIPYLPHSHITSVSAPAAASFKSISVISQTQSKVPSSPCFALDKNSHEEPMDTGTDDLFISARDRKVRISDGSSVYALCRSWLRNGYKEQIQLQCADYIKSLPKPSAMAMCQLSPMKRKDCDDEPEIEEDEKSIENLSEKELLQKHIKRAKRVRARLREERLQRIARYKSRLALLLPPVIEQCGNDCSNGA